MRAGKIDERTAPAKARKCVVAVLAEDWGGPDAMPGAARLLADRIGVLTVRLMLREQRLMREAAAGIDDPSSDKHTIALHNAFSRSLARLEEMRARDGQREHGPSLGEYLASRSNGNGAGNGAAAPPAHAPTATQPETPAASDDAASGTQSNVNPADNPVGDATR